GEDAQGQEHEARFHRVFGNISYSPPADRRPGPYLPRSDGVDPNPQHQGSNQRTRLGAMNIYVALPFTLQDQAPVSQARPRHAGPAGVSGRVKPASRERPSHRRARESLPTPTS